MTYQEIIQQVGKQIEPTVFYYDDQNKKIEIDRDNFEYAKPKFNAKLVGTVMKALEIELKEELPNKQIYLKVKASYDNQSAVQTYGPYYLKEKPIYNADSKTYTHYCYDQFVKTMIGYEPIDITYPCTIYQFYKKLIETLGLTTNVSSLINGELLIASDIYAGIDFTYRTVLEDIAQANGILFEIDGTTVKEAVLGANAIKAVVDDDILKNTNIDFGEHFGPINTIVLSRSADSDNVYLDDPISVEKNGRKEFKIEDNQLMNENNRSDFLPALLKKLNGIEFDIFDTELVGYGGFKPLQKVTFVTGENIYNSYVFNNDIEITQGYAESIYTDLPEETTIDYKAADKEDKKINQVYIIVRKQEKRLEALASEASESSEKVAKLQLDVNSITTDISHKYDFLEDEEGKNQLKLENSLEYQPVSFNIQGNTEKILYFYPTDILYPRNDLYPLGITEGSCE